MKYNKTFVLLCAITLSLFACKQKAADSLRMGIIGPSINHLPLTYSLAAHRPQAGAFELIKFSSGWEAQEALIAGKIDAAIMPFSYAWNAASRGYPVKIVSFLERESDAIVAKSSIQNVTDLQGRKIGVLKASTVELLMIDFAEQADFSFEPVFFRTPNELVASLQAGQVDAIVAYVPLIQKISGDFKVLHWFGESHPHHPCCDIAINQKHLNSAKTLVLKELIDAIHSSLPDIESRDKLLLDHTKTAYKLDDGQVREALTHTRFSTGLDESGKELQRRMMRIAVQKGYQKNLVDDDKIYLELP